MAIKTFRKDPDAVLDYKWDWSNWLGSGESITGTPTITVPAGITKDSQSNDTNSVTVWLSGGTHGQNYQVTCRITTDNAPARVDERTIQINVRNR